MSNQFLGIFLPLFFAHLLTDFALQSDGSVKKKGKIPVLIQHGLAAGFLSYVVLGSLGAWRIPVGIAVSHTLLDAWKLRSKWGSRLFRFVVDQAGHLLILLLFSWAAGFSPEGTAGIWLVIFGRPFLAVLTVVSGAMISVYVASFVVELAVETLGIRSQENSIPATSPESRERLGIGLIEGGRVIGYLERGLIFVFILAGYPGGIGFLVAAKSVFRFGELTDSGRRSQAEYIIIGTLLSILLGSVVSYLTVEILQVIFS